MLYEWTRYVKSHNKITFYPIIPSFYFPSRNLIFIYRSIPLPIYDDVLCVSVILNLFNPKILVIDSDRNVYISIYLHGTIYPNRVDYVRQAFSLLYGNSSTLAQRAIRWSVLLARWLWLIDNCLI